MKRSGTRRVVGIDCHPDSFVAALVIGSNADDATVEKVSDSLPLEQLFDGYLERFDDVDVVALEASANSFAVADKLIEQGFEVLVVESRSVAKQDSKAFATDRTSAVSIARAVLGGVSDKVWIPDPLTRQRRAVFTAYRQAVKDRTRARNRITSALNVHAIRLPKGTRLTTDKGRKLVMSLRDWSLTETILLDQAFADLNRAEDKYKSLRRLMIEEILGDPAMFSLLRIFGFRHVTIYGLVAVVGNVRRFANAKKLCSYLGVCPRGKRSGKSVSKSAVDKTGRGDVRSAIVQAAHVAFHHNTTANPLYQWAHRTSFRRGKQRAVVAVARKLVTAAYYVLNGKRVPIAHCDERRSIHGKFMELAAELGRDAIRYRGFKTHRDFANQNLIKLEAAS